MKKKLELFAAGLCLAVVMNAQTNTFPSSGNVGIGTISPTGNLHSNVIGVFNTTPLIRLGLDDATGRWDVVNAGNPTTRRTLNGYDGTTKTIYFDPNYNCWINTGGSFGIGTTSPVSKLSFGTGAAFNTVAKRLAIEEGTDGAYFYGIGGAGNTGKEGLGLWGGTESDIPWNGNTGIQPHMFIKRNSGYIGIGTITPNYPLSFGVNNGTTLALFENGGVNMSGLRYNATRISLELITNDIVGLSVNGKYVGIGTTNPQNTLDVNGTIHAREVKVDLTGWSDFVFTTTYKLKPLAEVEQYIKTNGHLENIPSAQEVEQNGVSIGDVQAKLLQKVEELTLYSIEQEKTIKELKELVKQNAELQSKFADQEKEMKELKELIMKKLK